MLATLVGLNNNDVRASISIGPAGCCLVLDAISLFASVSLSLSLSLSLAHTYSFSPPPPHTPSF